MRRGAVANGIADRALSDAVKVRGYRFGEIGNGLIAFERARPVGPDVDLCCKVVQCNGQPEFLAERTEGV